MATNCIIELASIFEESIGVTAHDQVGNLFFEKNLIIKWSIYFLKRGIGVTMLKWDIYFLRRISLSSGASIF